MKKLPATILMIVFLSLENILAQFNFYSYYEGIYDDNIFNNSDNISDYINSFSLGAAYNLESEFNNVQLYYEGSLSLFQNTTSKSFGMHRLGLVETHLFEIDDNPLNAGINYSFRNNRDDFEVFDFNQLSVYINYRHSVSESDFIIPGYIFNRNNYKNFTLFSHNEHRVFLTWNSNYETRTSLTLNAEYLIKLYFEEYEFTGYLNEASQMKFRLNLGQALNDKTGLSGYAVYRSNISEGSRYLLSDSLLFYEEEIFNDIYSYDGIEAGIGLKHYFSETTGMNLEAKYMIRNYSSLPAVDRTGTELDIMRQDKQFAFGAGFSFDLGSIFDGLSLAAAWNYYKNNSNDYYYKYSNHILSVSLDYDF